jgi:hypothetical protein
VLPLRTVFCAALAGLAALAAVGCGGPRYVPVSGVVTLNGKPYPGAVVNFQPVATGGDAYPGRGSYGHTDSEGRFTLVVDDKVKGAVVGKHRVRIATREEVTPYRVSCFVFRGWGRLGPRGAAKPAVR